MNWTGLRWTVSLGVLVVIASLSSAFSAEPVRPFPGKPAFEHRGFYLHAGWFFNHPFAVRTWSRGDYRAMFHLLGQMGFDRVMLWPMLESIPAPLGDADAAALQEYRATIDDAHAAGLECWLTQCPNLTPVREIAAKPWIQRSPYRMWKTVRMDDPAQAQPYLAHRTAMLAILNNADGYVTIDGDPGGYAGAKPEEFLKVFLADRAAINRYGVAPNRQKVIPWIWCGWGAKGVWQEPIRPFTEATMALLRKELPEPWEMLPGRSYRDGHANGRINFSLAEKLGLMGRSTLMCYEAIEFEPTPPAAVLQFGHIRRIVKEELRFAGRARGIFGNAQQPIMVLPNMYLFARGAWEPAYLDQPDQKVLADLAKWLGGPEDLLVPAWQCLQKDLAELPADLAERLRAAKLQGEPAKHLPGGPERYLDILSRQVDSRRRLLEATAQRAGSDEQAAKAVVAGTASLVDWWRIHRYVNEGAGDEPFQWNFVHGGQVGILQTWCRTNVKEPAVVAAQAAHLLAVQDVLPQKVAEARMTELLKR